MRSDMRSVPDLKTFSLKILKSSIWDEIASWLMRMIDTVQLDISIQHVKRLAAAVLTGSRNKTVWAGLTTGQHRKYGMKN